MSKNGYKKVCIVTNHENTILLFRKELVLKLVKEGYRVCILLPDFCDNQEIKKLGVKVQPYVLKQHGMNPLDEVRSLLHLKKILKRLHPDIVLTYTIKPNLYAGIACRILKIPYIATITGMGRGFEHNSVINSILGKALSIGLKGAKSVIFQNQEARDFFIPKYMKKEQGIVVGGSGVDLSSYNYEEYPKNNTPQLLFLGRITRDKGINELIEAVQDINADGTHVTLTFVGPVEPDCEEKVNLIKQLDYFHFAGMQDHDKVHDYIKETDAVVVPSYHEGMCNALLEAASTGRPVITTRISGCKEAFDEGLSGLGCEPRSKKSLERTLRHFLAMTRDDHRKMGKAGRTKMEQEFDRKVIIEKYIEAIEN